MSYIESKYFSFLDADDSISENYVEAFIRENAKSQSDIVVVSGYKVWNNGRKKEHYNINLYKVLAKDITAITCIADCGSWGKFFHQSLWDKRMLGFP